MTKMANNRICYLINRINNEGTKNTLISLFIILWAVGISVHLDIAVGEMELNREGRVEEAIFRAPVFLTV